ncbi:hypothetical protein MTO96_026849 [Rhipicephalus appendiculatus]
MRTTQTEAAATRRTVAESWPRSSQTWVTYIRRGTGINTAIYLTLTSLQSNYAWTTSPDTWGSDHFPIVVSLPPGRRPRRRTYMVTDWVKFRRLRGEVEEGENFLASIAACARAATVECSVKPNTPCSGPVPAEPPGHQKTGRTQRSTYTEGGALDDFPASGCLLPTTGPLHRQRQLGQHMLHHPGPNREPLGMATPEGALGQKGKPQAHPGRRHHPGRQRGDLGRAPG